MRGCPIAAERTNRFFLVLYSELESAAIGNSCTNLYCVGKFLSEIYRKLRQGIQANYQHVRNQRGNTVVVFGEGAE